MINIKNNNEDFFINEYNEISLHCNLPQLDKNEIITTLYDFLKIYGNRQILKNIGGAGEYPSAWIFLIARAINPSLIIESGVWKGHTSWLFKKACPASNVHSFDINLKNLVHNVDDVNYYENDWIDNHIVENIPNKGKSLVYFDDHVNQCKRIKEAYDLGFKYLLFDDNEPVINGKYNVSGPAHPTLSLLYSDYKFNNKITFMHKEKEHTYTYLEKDTYNAKKYIKKIYIIPKTFCHLTVVELED